MEVALLFISFFFFSHCHMFGCHDSMLRHLLESTLNSSNSGIHCILTTNFELVLFCDQNLAREMWIVAR